MPVPAAEPVRLPRSWRTELLTGLSCAAVVVLLGAPVGLLWSALSPRAQVVAVQGGLDYTDGETKAFIAADAYLLLLGLGLGLVCGALAWRFGRRHRLGALLGLVLGAGAAAWVASRTGVLGGDRAGLLAQARAGRLTGPTDLPLALHARAVLLAWPGGAALGFAVLAYREKPAPPLPAEPPPAPEPPPSGWPAVTWD